MAILLIVAVPKIIKLFNDTKKNAFITQTHQIYKAANQNILSNAFTSSEKNQNLYCYIPDFFDTSSTVNNTISSMKLEGTNKIGYRVEFGIVNGSKKIIDISVFDKDNFLRIKNSNGVEINDVSVYDIKSTDSIDLASITCDNFATDDILIKIRRSAEKAKRISASSRNSAAIDKSNVIYLWGGNKFESESIYSCRQTTSLGIDLTENEFKNRINYVNTPKQLKNSTLKFKRISLGGLYHNFPGEVAIHDETYIMAIDESGYLWIWGSNVYGQLGNGTQSHSQFVKIAEGTKFIAVQLGEYHALAIDDEDNLWAWGNNEFGQIGNGTYGDPVLTPTMIMSLK